MNNFYVRGKSIAPIDQTEVSPPASATLVVFAALSSHVCTFRATVIVRSHNCLFTQRLIVLLKNVLAD
jgi:hypothetical protein